MGKWIASLLTILLVHQVQESFGYKIVCYWGSWSVYRNGNGKFQATDIDPQLCTHFIYTFVGISTSGDVVYLDAYNDIADNWGKNSMGIFNDLRSQNTNAKTLVAIGGWNEGSEKYSQVMNNPTTRAAFVNNAYNFVINNGFDGFDLDWEYPALRGGVASDKQAFVELLKEMRAKFDEGGLLISAAVGAGAATVDAAYDVPSLSKYLDFINVMTYDLHGSWDKKTGQNAPLYASSADQTDTEKTLNVDYAIKHFINLGADPKKLILGMGTYGRSYTLSDANNKGVGAPISGDGSAGPYTQQAGFLGYNELCEKFATGGWTVSWDDQQKTPIAISGNQWVGYDNPESLKIKSQYVVDNGLGGGMIWSLETEDLHNICGGGAFPLLKAINSVLGGDNSGSSGGGDGGNSGGGDSGSATTKKTTTTTTTTTTQAPGSGSGGSSTGVCSSQGYVRDPNNCQIFYYCQLVDGAYVSSQFTCATGTYYDTSSGSCNWASQVSC